MHQVTVSDIADLCMAPRASATNDIARYANSLPRYSVLGTLDRGGGAHSVNSGRAPAGLSAWPWLGIAAPGGPSRPRPNPLPSPLPLGFIKELWTGM
eukprot:scaffold60917_cov51-Phaeocystis_antarctica.AAC.1